jgi:HEAT repeat protein
MDGTLEAGVVHGGARTAQDACATLIEVARALKGWLFYGPADPARRELVDRAWRVVQAEVERSGPLVLDVRRGAFWLAGTDDAVGVGRIDELARRLYERAVSRVVFEPETDPASLEAFLEAIALAPGAVADAGGFEARFFAAPRRGIRINDTDWRCTAIAPEPPAAALPEVDEAELATTLPDLGDDPLEYTAPPHAAPAEEPPALDLLDALDPETSQPSIALPEPPLLDEAAERLRDLEDCEDDARYRDAAGRLVYDAREWIAQGRLDDGHRVLAAFAAHASDDAKRSFAQRESARECLGQLAKGAALGDLVRRVCDADADASVAAVAVLREIGGRAAPRLLDEIEREPAETEQHARLVAALLALGEEAAPALSEAIVEGTPRRKHTALRLAGETQNPRLVASLRDALLGDAADTSREAAHALVRIGDVGAIEVLAEALESGRNAVIHCAAQALATTGRAIAVAPLAAALDRAVAAKQLGLARDLVRALGRLARPEAVPALAELLDRGGFFQRARLRDLKLAAIQALGHVPGLSADHALAQVARSGDASLRQAAEAARRRRASAAKPKPGD